MRFSGAAGFAAGAACALVLAGSTAYAATGGSFVLGRSNSASTTTTLSNPVGTPLRLTAKAGAAPLAVGSGTKVANLNSDRLDGLDGGQLQRRITGTCPDNTAVRAVAAAGSVSCTDLDGFLYESATAVDGIATVWCPEGFSAVSGGGTTLLTSPALLAGSYSRYDESAGREGWTAIAKDPDGDRTGVQVTVEVFCWSGPVESAS